MIIKAHTSIIGDTGYNCHSRNFFKALHKIIPVQVRNFTVGSSWEGYNNDEPHNKEYYMDDVLKEMLVDQTLNTPNGREEFPLYQNYKNNGNPDIHIVLNENNHHYFYDNYDGKKIAYNVWETTKYQDDFFERLKTFDQVWVPTQWQKDCTVEQGIPEWKVKVVPEGVDVKTYKPKNYVVSKPVNRPFRFILVGRWDYRKATKEIIETFTKTFSEDENVELLINVDNPFAYDGMNSTEERLERYGIKHSGIKILHHLSKKEYVETLKSADVFLSCARGEGWNLPLIEAMSCGIPSLYSNWGAQLEFADGRGIPVDIVGEVPANVQGNDKYFSWTKDAPGNFIEPDFKDLSKKMRDVVDNYIIYKKKALDDSDEIREIFTWENAAKIANKILQEFMNEDNAFDDSVAIVLAHANTPRRRQLLKDCLSSIKMKTILSTNYTVDEETQKMADWVVYSKENPILLKHEFEKYGVSYFRWWNDENGNRVTAPFEYEHGYAAYELTKKGIQYAKLLGKKRVHIINYDYIISSSTLNQNEKLLDENDIVLYEHRDWDFEQTSYCSAFFSAKIDVASSYFTKYKSKEDYYRSMSGFNILEINMANHFKDSPYRIFESSINDLKIENKVNQEQAENITTPYAEYETELKQDKSIKETKMAHREQQEYCSKIKDIFPEYFKGKRVLDIGSLDINGNNKYLFDGCDYFGLDVGEGENVDIVSVGHIYDAPNETFDTIISTEVFEHDMFYEETVKNIIRMLKPGGSFIFTCASTGRPEHGTRKSDGSFAAPLLIQISEKWSDYYKNITENDIRIIDGFNEAFPDGVFEYNSVSGDLYFFGVKGGIESLKKQISIKNVSDVEVYLTIDSADDLFLNIDSKSIVKKDQEIIIDITYGGDILSHTVKTNQHESISLGKYKRGHTVRVSESNIEIFSKFLEKTPESFRRRNRLFGLGVDAGDENKIFMNFVNGPFIEIKGSQESTYIVKFIDDDSEKIIYQTTIKNNQWAMCNRKWFVNWRIRIEYENGKFYDYKIDLKNRRVFIVFESSSLGDTIAWIPYVEEFRKKHGCNVIVSTFHNELFQSQYPEIEFVKPGTTVNNLYGLYRLGWFYDGNNPNYSMNKSDFTKIPLQQTATDILGLDFEEIRPHMKSIEPMKSDKPYICIANHSTAQSKYWNNPTGWQELVDYVKELGYDVYLLSKEEDGYMGNKNPKGVIKVDGKTLEEIGSILLGSKGFIGLGSGLSWFSWALEVPTILISGFSETYQEMKSVYRIINESVCHGCFARHTFDKGDWNWCPDHKNTDRQFECTKEISFEMIKPNVNKILGLNR